MSENSKKPVPKLIELTKECKYQLLIKENEGSILLHSGYVCLKKDENVGKHTTKNCEEILIILEGTGKVIVENNCCNVKKGDVFYIPCNMEHDVISLSNTLMYIFVTAKILKGGSL